MILGRGVLKNTVYRNDVDRIGVPDVKGPPAGFLRVGLRLQAGEGGEEEGQVLAGHPPELLICAACSRHWHGSECTV